ncbi:MAG: hypothetical protein HW377_1302 [Actinobacteria bacterium]|jgi:predicted CxxxxCH...CXXCH cytochrome family protein|nr:hypothetical protein [Actinomycetota bacterium]
MRNVSMAVGILLAFAALTVPAHAAGSSHAKYITLYEGPATCTATACHENTAKEVAESLHYQQRAVPQFLEGWEAGKPAGMMESY